MRLYARLAAVVAMVVLATTAAWAYSTTLVNDGTTTWLWQTVSGQLTLNAFTNATSASGSVVLTIDPVNGPLLPATVTVASLPACGATLKGALRTVSDATTPTYNGTLTGSGAVIVPVFCNGTAWVSH